MGPGQTTRKNPPGEEVLPIPSAEPPPLPGSQRFELPRVPGFQLLRELARGGMGVVYEAWSEELGQTVALKLLQAHLVIESDALQRITREVAAQARVRHPNIVKVLASGRVGGLPWLAMELVQGETLEQRIKRKGPLPQPLAAAWARALAGALTHAHSVGVLHRDLKPSNVLLGPDQHPRLTDFGLALLADEKQRLTRSGVVLGSPSYMAPEQAQGDPSGIGPHTDVYGLGAIMHEMLTGVPPHQGSSQVEVLESVLTRDPAPLTRRRPDVDPGLESICLRCLARVPERRHASMADVMQALEAWELGASRRTTRPRFQVAPAVLAALAAGLVLVGALFSLPGPPTAPTPPSAASPPPAVESRADPLVELRRALERSDCAALLGAAELASRAGLGPEGDLESLSAPARSRLLFALHLRRATIDPEALVQTSPELRRLLREPDGEGPWKALARAVQMLEDSASFERIALATNGLERALPEADRSPWAWFLLGGLQCAAPPGPGPEAGRALERALELDPGLWMATLLQVRHELARGDQGRARQVLEPLLRSSGDAPAVRMIEASLLLAEGELEEADDALARLGARGLDVPLLTELRAELRLARSHPAPALELAEEVLRRPLTDQLRQNARRTRALALYGLARYTEAADAFQEIASEAQLQGWVHVNAVEGWAMTLLRLEQVEPVLRRLRAMPLQNPRMRAIAERIEAEARAMAERAPPADMGLEELRALARRCVDQEDWARLVVVMDRFLRIDPRARDALIERARAYMELDRWAEAMEDLERAGRLAPQDAVELEGVAVCLAATGQFARAADVFERAAALEPEEFRHRQALARTLIDAGALGRAERAIEDLSSRARGEGEVAAARWLLARLRRGQGRPREALEALRAIPARLIGDLTEGAPVSRRLHEPLLRYLERRVASGG